MTRAGEAVRDVVATARPAKDLENRPALVIDLEMSHPVRPVSRCDSAAMYNELLVLVRIFEEPLGTVRIVFAEDVLSESEITTSVRAQFGEAIADRVRAAGGDACAVLAGEGTHPTDRPAFLAAHDRWLRDGPEVTVAICTRDRAPDVARALDSLRSQSYRRFRVMVIDNAPSDDATRALVASRPREDRVEYVREPKPGLSWARNRALARVATPVIAWLDDDEVADRHWLIEIAAAYCTHPGAAAVSGVVLPAELRTQPQMWFEEFGGHSKGRGFVRDSFTATDANGQSPLYPLPPFGVGANMSFDVERLRAIGGFDTALGAGTLTHGGEDTLAFTQLLLRGGVVVYQPTSMTRHYHRADYAALVKQMRGYGIGLTAYYASLLRSDWRLVGRLVRLAPKALRDTSRGGEARDVPTSFPQELLRVKTQGILRGPWAYVRARRAARRLSTEKAAS